MRLSEAQQAERAKYAALAKGKYGSSLHARTYIAGIVRYGPPTIADFGCGDNEFCKRLRQSGFWALGLDWIDYGKAGILHISPP